MKATTLFFAAVCASALSGGCKGKDGDPGPAGPAGQTLTGSITGYATTYDERGNRTAKSGTTVTIENQTPALTTTTDADGRFQFTGLKMGTYNIIYSRTDYGTMKRFGVGHVGGGQPTYLGNQDLSVVATPVIVSFGFGAFNIQTWSLDYGVSLNIPPPSGRVVVYFSNTTSVSYSNFIFSSSAYGQLNGRTMYGSAYKSLLNSAGLAPGTVAYAIAYPVPLLPSSYTDQATGLIVAPCLGAPSSVQSFIVP